MRFLLFTVLCLPFTVMAQAITITEISPHKVGLLEEWLEFRVESEVDLSQYQISNGRNLSKPLETALPGEELGYYYFEKSPVSLANDGGTLQVLDLDGVIIAEVSYPKLGSGSTKNYDWAEVWNINGENAGPLIYRSDGDPNYAHTRGNTNRQLPTDPDKYQLLISEAAPKRDQDFLEFRVASGPEDINLKYTEFKHNGTALFRVESDLRVSPGDFITLYLGAELTGLISSQEIRTDRRDGLSGGSGTVEVISYSATSLEKTEDFLCWKDEVLSKTEQARVDKNILERNWEGACYEISDFIDNQSISRPEGDTNTVNDFENHFNGSPGSANVIQNNPPQAVITIQGSGKKVGKPPFSLNVTGENSTDPDGSKDIASYQWWLNEVLFSEKPNPLNQRLETIGDYTLKLRITDASGDISEVTENIFVIAGNSAPSVQNSAQFQAVIAQQLSSTQKSSVSDEVDHFFAPVLRNTQFIESIRTKYIGQKPTIVLGTHQEIYKRRITLPKIVRQRLRRNLGLIWDWREAEWAAAVGSISDGAIDRNSERFAVAFGVP